MEQTNWHAGSVQHVVAEIYFYFFVIFLEITTCVMQKPL